MARETARSIEIPHDWSLPYDRVKADRQYDEGIKAAADAARAKHSGDMVGETLRWGVADGYAIYMVVKQKPLTIQHVDQGDGYRVSHIMVRGLRLADVRDMVERDRAMAKLFGPKAE